MRDKVGAMPPDMTQGSGMPPSPEFLALAAEFCVTKELLEEIRNKALDQAAIERFRYGVEFNQLYKALGITRQALYNHMRTRRIDE